MSETTQHHYQFLLKPTDAPGYLVRQLAENPYRNPITYTVSAIRKLLHAIYSGELRVADECYYTPPLAGLDAVLPNVSTLPVDEYATSLLRRLVNEPLASVQMDLITYAATIHPDPASAFYAVSMRYALQVTKQLNLNYLDTVIVDIALAITSPMRYGCGVDNPTDRIYQFDLQPSYPHQTNPMSMSSYKHFDLHQDHFGPEWIIVPYRISYDQRPSITVTLDIATGVPAERGSSGKPSQGLLLIPALLFWYSAQLRSPHHG